MVATPPQDKRAESTHMNSAT